MEIPFSQTLAPHVSLEEIPPHVMLPSPAHTVIERFWYSLREKEGLSLKDKLLEGQILGHYNPNSEVHQ